MATIKVDTIKRLAILAVAFLTIWWIFSGTKKGTPEDQIRSVMNLLVKAAENHEMGAFETYLSDQLQDQSGLGKVEVLQRIRLLYLRHPSIHLEILSLDFHGSSPQARNVDMELLMSTTHIPQDKGTYEFVFRLEDGKWKMFQLNWGEGYGQE